MIYRIAICDDDQEFEHEIHNYIQGFCRLKKVKVLIKIYSDSSELMADLERKKFYDLYILDIQMPGYSGIDLLNEFNDGQVVTDIILLTSYTEYAMDTYMYNQVFRYIPKDLVSYRLDKALNDFFVKMDQKKCERPYVIQNRVKSIKIYQENIVYIYKDQKYAVFAMINGDEERERIGLSQLYKRLRNTDMILLNRSYIVNLRHVKRIQAGEVTMEAGSPIYAGREHIIKLKEKFNKYWGNLY